MENPEKKNIYKLLVSTRNKSYLKYVYNASTKLEVNINIRL